MGERQKLNFSSDGSIPRDPIVSIFENLKLFIKTYETLHFSRGQIIKKMGFWSIDHPVRGNN